MKQEGARENKEDGKKYEKVGVGWGWRRCLGYRLMRGTITVRRTRIFLYDVKTLAKHCWLMSLCYSYVTHRLSLYLFNEAVSGSGYTSY
jgi:hypothetical protein